MILDSLENIKNYLPLNRGFQKAVEFLQRSDLKDLPAGNYDIDGDNVFATVAKDIGRNKEDALLEIHRKYIDIQMVLRGVDNMGWRYLAACKDPAGEYDEERDIRFFKDEPYVWLPVKGGMFAIFFPEDAHLPMISEGEIHKIIVKIAGQQR